MNTTNASIMAIVMTTILTLSAPLVYADNGNGGYMSGGQPAVSDAQSPHKHHHGGMLFHKLNLTDDQKKQLNGIWQKQREARKATFEQIKTDKDALTNELLQTTPDMNKINDLKLKMEALHSQMFDDRVNSNLEVKKILTAEQFAQYLEFQKHRFSDRSHRREWKHCGHHHKHHHRGYWGDQHEGDNGGND